MIKTFFLMAVTYSAALVSAEPPAVIELPEIPAQYCGTFYLHEKQSKPGQTERVVPPQALGKIEAQQVLLEGAHRLKVVSIQQTIFPGRDGKPVPSIVVRFAQTNLMWGVAAMPDSSLGIMQLVFDAQNNTLGEFVWLGVSRNQAAVLQPATANAADIHLAADPQPPLLTPLGGALPVGSGPPPSAPPPVVTELPELLPQYCGTYYLHGKVGMDAGVEPLEQFAPAKPFGRIEPKQITLEGGKVLKITGIQHMVFSNQARESQKTMITIQFEKSSFRWVISEMEDGKLAIVQSGFTLDGNKMQGTMFVVSQQH